MSAGAWTRICWIALLLSGGVAAAQAPEGASKAEPPTAEELARRVAAAWDPVRVRLEATMTVERANRPASTTDLLIRRAGHGRTRVDFLSPARDRGKVMLEVDGETWLYLPRAGRVVEVPARRNPLAGGVLFEDLFPRDAGDSAVAVETHDDGFVLVTSGGPGGGPGGSRITFDPSTLLPVRREVYSSSGRLLKTLFVEETLDWQGARIPSKVRLVDHLRHGAEARIEIHDASELTGDLEELFSKDHLQPAADAGAEDRP